MAAGRPGLSGHHAVDIGADLAPVEEKYGSVEAALGQGYPPVIADAWAQLRETVMRRRMQEQLTPATEVQKMRAGSRARRVEL